MVFEKCVSRSKRQRPFVSNIALPTAIYVSSCLICHYALDLRIRNFPHSSSQHNLPVENGEMCEGKMKDSFVQDIRTHIQCSTDKQGSWKSRTCLLKNACYNERHRSILYFSGNSTLRLNAPFINLRAYSDGRSRPYTPSLVVGTAKNNLKLSFKPGVFVLKDAFWPENFGHALFDDFWSLFQMLSLFELADCNEVNILLNFPGCFKGHKHEDRVRGCRNHEEMKHVITSTPIRNVTINYKYLAALNVNDLDLSETECYQSLVMGTGGFHITRAEFHHLFIFLKKMLSKLDPTRGLLHKFLGKPKSIRAAVIKKEGRRRVINVDEIARVCEEMGMSTDIVSSSDIEKMSLKDQVKLALDYSLIITPAGGLSFLTLFMRVGTSAILYTHFDPVTNSTGLLEFDIWNRVYWKQTLRFDVTEKDIRIEKNQSYYQEPIASKFDLYRNYGSATIQESEIRLQVTQALEYIKSARMQERLPY